jgi:hypothetical protein
VLRAKASIYLKRCALKPLEIALWKPFPGPLRVGSSHDFEECFRLGSSVVVVGSLIKRNNPIAACAVAVEKAVAGNTGDSIQEQEVLLARSRVPLAIHAKIEYLSVLQLD